MPPLTKCKKRCKRCREGSGFIKVKSVVVGLKSPNSLYAKDLAELLPHLEMPLTIPSAVGFINIWGLPVVTWKQVHDP